MSLSPFNTALLAMCLASSLAACRAAEHTPAPSSTVAGPLRLDGVAIVDPATGTVTPGMSILMSAGRIVSITPTGAAPAGAPAATRVIDATGKFVVPGYNNMHSHALTAPNATGALAIMLAEGVTGFRQMDGSPALLAARRNGTLPLGPDTPALLAMPGSLVAPQDPESVPHAIAEVQLQK